MSNKFKPEIDRVHTLLSHKSFASFTHGEKIRLIAEVLRSAGNGFSRGTAFHTFRTLKNHDLAPVAVFLVYVVKTGVIDDDEQVSIQNPYRVTQRELLRIETPDDDILAELVKTASEDAINSFEWARRNDILRKGYTYETTVESIALVDLETGEATEIK